eukprot:TRINITY_DN747_c0_g1_i1.p1 TRINITY_DN747_c0_g1~~TRINITY_DN747_c0_g1_i1.p1  ORF type:complete len:246 (-),score=67.38 TRINITY_DN747_c0_g1_i1:43-729(-)
MLRFALNKNIKNYGIILNNNNKDNIIRKSFISYKNNMILSSKYDEEYDDKENEEVENEIQYKYPKNIYEELIKESDFAENKLNRRVRPQVHWIKRFKDKTRRETKEQKKQILKNMREEEIVSTYYGRMQWSLLSFERDQRLNQKRIESRITALNHIERQNKIKDIKDRQRDIRYKKYKIRKEREEKGRKEFLRVLHEYQDLFEEHPDEIINQKYDWLDQEDDLYTKYN